MRRGCFAALIAALLVGCGEELSYQVPGPDTDPPVTLDLPEARRINRGEDPEGAGVRFANGSNDLVVIFAGEGGDDPDRVIDFAHPERTELIGYGAFEGELEIYRRSPMVDGNGIHGTRTAVYRVDPEGNHTNAWFTHWASSVGVRGRIFLTEYGHWNWQDGQERSETFSDSAWPIMGLFEDSRSFDATVFSVLPGAFSANSYEFLSVEGSAAISPTLEIPDCLALSFGGFGGEDSFIAYFHETFGLVEVLYDWRWANNVVDLDDLQPISGFAVADPIERPPTLDIRHVWFGGTYAASVEAQAYVPGGVSDEAVRVPWEVELTIDFAGTEARASSGRHTIHGELIESDGSVHELVGISDGFEFELRSRNSERDNGVGRASIEISGKAVEQADGLPALSALVYRLPASDGDVALSFGLARWTPLSR